MIIQLTNTPKVVQDLITRIKAKLTTDGYTSILNEVELVGKMYWFNMPYKLNLLVTALKEYPDSDVVTLAESIGKIYWANYYLKLADLIDLTEVIEAV